MAFCFGLREAETTVRTELLAAASAVRFVMQSWRCRRCGRWISSRQGG